MSRRSSIVGCTALFALLLGFFILGHNIERVLNRVSPIPLPAITAMARRIHDSALVADLHSDSLLCGRDLLERSRVGHVDLPRLRDGGVGLQFFSIVTKVPVSRHVHQTGHDSPDVITLLGIAGGLGYGWRTPFERALLQLSRLKGIIAHSAGGMLAIESRNDLEALLEIRTSSMSPVY